MRPSEWIQGGFVVIVALAAWVYPLDIRRRRSVTLLAACAVLVIALGRLSQYVLGPFPASILRDWLPVPLTLFPYWQTGQFFTRPNRSFQAWLVESDRWLFGFLSRWVSRTGWTFGRFARATMEWAYMLCYPLVPLGLTTLYAAGLRSDGNTFWFLVLVPTYLCYAITPFFPAVPPRDVEAQRTDSLATGSPVLKKTRVFNLWLLKNTSIHAISFPSAHVASSLAVSLALLHFVPLAGVFFLLLTCWIAVAAVVGGHHYAVDVVLGSLVTLGVYLAWHSHLIPSTLFTAPAIAFLAPL